MLNSGNQNGVIPTADDLEKGEVFETGQQGNLEEGEVYDITGEGGLEKRRDAYETEEPELLEPLLAPAEAEHPELAAASKPLILIEKIVVSLLILIIVLVEAYFVGRSFRQDQDHYHDDGKSTNNTEIASIPLPVKLRLLVPIDVGANVKESIAAPEPFEDFVGGSLNWGIGPTKKGFVGAVTKMPPTSRPSRIVNAQLLPLPMMVKEDEGISKERSVLEERIPILRNRVGDRLATALSLISSSHSLSRSYNRS